jgi:hypothetical protein
MRRKVFIGYDPRDDNASKVLELSLHEHSSIPLDIILLKDHELRSSGAYRRSYRVDNAGQMWDDIDGKPFSTQFSFSRFLVPHLCAHKNEWVLFLDADMMFRGDVAELFALADSSYSVMCVKHEQDAQDGVMKMDGVLQTKYERKNWSSMMLMNPARCDRLTVHAVNSQYGSLLHGMSWADDDDIGAIDEKWNWLGGHSDNSIDPMNVHFTLGTPDMEHYTPTDYDFEWWDHLDMSKKGRLLHATA